jgi:hypothetical protein
MHRPFALSVNWLLPLYFGLVPVHSFAMEPKRPSQENSLSRAVFAEGRLWLLSDAGELSSIKEGEKTRIGMDLPDPALDLCLRDGHPEVATGARQNCNTWTLRRWADSKWTTLATVPADRETLVSLVCSSDSEILLTTKRLIEVTATRPRSVVELSTRLRRGIVTSVHATKGHLFVGTNAGEWGGGLLRIERQSGKVEEIEKNATGELCGGPLNGSCDPVNGIAPEPWQPDCVAVAVGLIHFSPHGRIVEVCGNRVQRIYFKAHQSQRLALAKSRSRESKDGEPFETVAFFGLARVGSQLWATGMDGVYKIDAGGKASMVPLPKFESIDNVGVSFEVPGVVLVLTSINQRMSISGMVPLLVPR